MKSQNPREAKPWLKNVLNQGSEPWWNIFKLQPSQILSREENPEPQEFSISIAMPLVQVDQGREPWSRLGKKTLNR